MARGAITGFVWGTLLSGVAVATASLTTPIQMSAPGPAAQADAQPGGAAPDAGPDVGPEVAPDAAPDLDPTDGPDSEGEGAPEVTETGPDPATERESGPEPGAEGVPDVDAPRSGGGEEAPDDDGRAVDPAAAQGDEPGSLPSEAGMAPQERPRPAGEEPTAESPRDPDPVASEPEPEPEPEVQLQALSPASTPSAADEAVDTPAAEDRAEVPAPTGFPASDLDALDIAPEIAPDRAPEITTGRAPDAMTRPPLSAGEPDADGAGTAPGAPAAEAPRDAPAVSPRLPQVGTGAGEDVASTAQAPRLPGQAVDGPLSDRGGPADGGMAVAQDDLPPIRAFAADYDASDTRPRMAVVLIDTGDSPVTFNALRSFPYPLSFALDPARPDALQAMRAYRDAGFEVLLRSDLPEGAAPADVETSAQSWQQALPEAVAVMEAEPGGLQKGRETSEQLAEVLADAGRGLVLYPEGLDTARKLAEREGVPAATLFRDFDAQGEDQKVIRRFLDYAALKADQEGGVIMVGRLRPETVSALLVWGLADRASQVQLVPVSAVLTERAQ
ncbi:MAG: hypothetical protein GYB53_10930 [Rhodobacteraceae bacterium]|nr:hypothetical protein [Paracoccaceae bacterium]